MVDGFYRNDMNLQFDTLSLTFLTTDLFSTTTVANDFLTDITNKKNSGQVPFVKNSRAILHVVTGRDFDSSTVGISNVGTLCSSASNAGTSQVVLSGGLPSLALTALVVAHEIGHNFNASHDGTGGNTCVASGFIMSASLSTNATRFSSCSVDEMTAKIDSLANVGQCFEFPVDASIVARPGNPPSANANENFTLDYDVAELHASVASAQLIIDGSFATPGGTFVAATIDGSACAIAADAQSYACTASTSGGLLEVTARAAGGATVTTDATVSVTSTGGVRDIQPANDTASQSVAATAPPAAPSGLTATPTTTEIDLAWQDNSSDETGFRIERRTGAAAFAQIATTAANATSFADTSATAATTYAYRVSAFGASGTSSPSATVSAQLVAPAGGGTSGGGGGGGAFGFELAPLLVGLFALRRRARTIA